MKPDRQEDHLGLKGSFFQDFFNLISNHNNLLHLFNFRSTAQRHFYYLITLALSRRSSLKSRLHARVGLPTKTQHSRILDHWYPLSTLTLASTLYSVEGRGGFGKGVPIVRPTSVCVDHPLAAIDIYTIYTEMEPRHL